MFLYKEIPGSQKPSGIALFRKFASKENTILGIFVCIHSFQGMFSVALRLVTEVDWDFLFLLKNFCL